MFRAQVLYANRYEAYARCEWRILLLLRTGYTVYLHAVPAEEYIGIIIAYDHRLSLFMSVFFLSLYLQAILK
jgi:hypothetical protein